MDYSNPSSDKRKPRLHACDVPKAMEKFMEELGQSPGVFSAWSTVCFIVSKRLVNSNSIFSYALNNNNNNGLLFP